MLNDEQRNEGILGLADALAEISQRYPLDLQRIERCANRLDVACDITGPASSAASVECAISARQMKFLALEFAQIAHEMQRLAVEALRSHAETVAQVRIVAHFRRTIPPSLLLRADQVIE